MFEKKKESEQEPFELHYDKVAEYVFECLVDAGYAPSGDEVLDIADIVFNFAVDLHIQLGGETEYRFIDEEGETD